MTNIKTALLYIWKIPIWLCVIFVSTLLITFIAMDIAIWASMKFNPNFKKIDSCLDKGGVWHYGVEQCAEDQETLDLLIEKFGPIRPEK